MLINKNKCANPTYMMSNFNLEKTSKKKSRMEKLTDLYNEYIRVKSIK